MSSTKLMETKDGRRFFQISVSRGYGKAPYKKRWYVPAGWSKRTAEREAARQAAEFERACAAGEVLNRAETKKKAADEAAERAKLKTFRQYADGVFMPTKETTFSENARSSYRMFLDKHILPTLGDTLLTDITPAMVTSCWWTSKRPDMPTLRQSSCITFSTASLKWLSLMTRSR